jgi:hypothetical protein
MKKNITDIEKQQILEMYGIISTMSLNESIKIMNRTISINEDGTLNITDINGKINKIRFTTKLGDINITNIEPKGNNLKITSRSGLSETIGEGVVNQIFNFVDTGKPKEIDSGSILKPNLILKKV